MNRLRAVILPFILWLAVAQPAFAELKPDDNPTITEGLRDKGVDWLKDKAKQAGKDWIFSTGQSDTMHEILIKARERADGEGNDKKGLCQYAVMGKASSILNDINAKWTVKTAGLLAFDTTVKMASLASGFGAAAGEGNALNWLTEQYTDAAKDAGKDAVFDRIKSLFIDEKKPEFELYETSGKNGECDYRLRAVWDIVHGTYRVYISGDCHCAKVGQFGLEPSPLGNWWISFEGHLTLNVDREKGTATWIPGPARMDFDAQCGCSKRELRKAFAVAPKAPTLVAPQPASSTSPTGRPPLPPAGRKVCKECQKIQDEIDADTKALDQAMEDVGRLDAAYREAKAKLGQHEGSLDDPAAYGTTREALQKQIETDKAAIKAIEKESATLETEQLRLMAALRDLARQLDECLKKNCQEGKAVIETPSISPENKKGVSYETDPFAARILTIHNEERAEVRVPPLHWNERLAMDAAAYALVLARTHELVHAPREGRGIERENLLQALPGWSPDRMMRSWTVEKRDFVPGYYPNVARDGKWVKVSHYTQISWPTTTDIGCGYAEGDGYGWLVCRYSPGGNKDGKPVGLPYVPERG